MNIISRWAIAVGSSFLIGAAAASAGDIAGAGATFPFPVYSKWAEAYKAKTGVGINYQSIGSGGGIKQIKAGTVTFGASDKPLEAAELATAGLVQWPMVIGGVVPVINVPGVNPGDLLLDGPTLARIYLGEISSWDDPAIHKLNPKLTLPKLAIAPVYRADGSGTNFLFTNDLSQVSPAFQAKVGANASVQWPTGLGAKGNEGVANQTKQTSGAIGYVEYAYVKQTHMNYVRMTNHDGRVVSPDAASFQAAAANADWSKAPGYYLILTNQPGKDSWPITGASFILVHAQSADTNVPQLLKFLDWAYADGKPLAEGLDYVTLPPAVVKMVEKTWATYIRVNGVAAWPAK